MGYEAQKAKIAAAIREIQAQLGHTGPGRPKAATDGAAPSKRIYECCCTEADCRCTTKTLGGCEGKPAPKKRRLSAAGRRAIIEATRKRWAAVRRAGAKKAKRLEQK